MVNQSEGGTWFGARFGVALLAVACCASLPGCGDEQVPAARESYCWPSNGCNNQAGGWFTEIKSSVDNALKAVPPTINQDTADHIVELIERCKADDGIIDSGSKCGTKGYWCCDCIKDARNIATGATNDAEFKTCADRLDHGHGGEDG